MKITGEGDIDMDDEIDLRETILMLWRGKFWIIGITALFILAAALFVFTLAAPVYRCSALLNLTFYEVKAKEVLLLLEQGGTIAEGLEDLVDDPGALVKSVKVDATSDNEFTLQLSAKFADPDICLSAVNRIGVTIIETLSEYRLEQLNQERERSEKLLVYLDEAIATYLLSRDIQITDLLEEDPVYKRLLEEKAATLIKLKLLDFKTDELAARPTQDAEYWTDEEAKIVQPISVNKKVYIGVAALLGLILAVFFLYLHHYFTAQLTSGNQEDQK